MRKLNIAGQNIDKLKRAYISGAIEKFEELKDKIKNILKKG